MTKPDLPRFVLDAFEIARDVTARFEESVLVRLIDADAFLDPLWLPHRAPRRCVEVLVGATGIFIVAMDRGRDLQSAEIQYPGVLDGSGAMFAEDETALRFAVLWQVRRGMLVIIQQAAPRVHGLFGP